MGLFLQPPQIKKGELTQVLPPKEEKKESSFFGNVFKYAKKVPLAVGTKVGTAGFKAGIAGLKAATPVIFKEKALDPYSQVQKTYKEINDPIILDPNIQWNLAKTGKLDRIKQFQDDIRKQTGKEVLLHDWKMMDIERPETLEYFNVSNELLQRQLEEATLIEQLKREDWERETGGKPITRELSPLLPRGKAIITDLEEPAKKELAFEPPARTAFPQAPIATQEKPTTTTEKWQPKDDSYYRGLIVDEKGKITDESREKARNIIINEKQETIDDREEILGERAQKTIKTAIDEWETQGYTITDEVRKKLDAWATEYIDTNKLTPQDYLDVYLSEPFKISRIEQMGKQDPVGIFLERAKASFTSGLLRANMEPETMTEEIVGVGGDLIGMITSLYLTGGALKAGAMLTRTGQIFAKTAPLTFELGKSVGAFNIHGQLSHGAKLDLDNRMNSVFRDTTMAAVFGLSSMAFPGRMGYSASGGLFGGLSWLNGDDLPVVITNTLAGAALHGMGFVKAKNSLEMQKNTARKNLEKPSEMKIEDNYTKFDIINISNEALKKGGDPVIIQRAKEFLIEKVPPRSRVFAKESGPINNIKRSIRQVNEELGALVGLKKVKTTAATLVDVLQPTDPRQPKTTKNGVVITDIEYKLDKKQIAFLKSKEGYKKYINRKNELTREWNKADFKGKRIIGNRLENLKGLGRQLGFEGVRITDIKTKLTGEDRFFATEPEFNITMDDVVQKTLEMEKSRFSQGEATNNAKSIRKTLRDISQRWGIGEESVVREFLRRTKAKQTGRTTYKENIHDEAVNNLVKLEPSEEGILALDVKTEPPIKGGISQESIEGIVRDIKPALKEAKTKEERSKLIEDTIKKEFPELEGADLKQAKSLVGKLMVGKDFATAIKEVKLSTGKPLTEPEKFAKIEEPENAKEAFEIFISPSRERADANQIGFTKIQDLVKEGKHDKVAQETVKLLDTSEKLFFDENISRKEPIFAKYGKISEGSGRLLTNKKDAPITEFIGSLVGKHTNQDSYLKRDLTTEKHPNLILKFDKKLSKSERVKLANDIGEIAPELGGDSFSIENNIAIVSYVPEYAKYTDGFTSKKGRNKQVEIVNKLEEKGYKFNANIELSLNSLQENKYVERIRELNQIDERVKRAMEKGREGDFRRRVERDLAERFGLDRADEFWETVTGEKRVEQLKKAEVKPEAKPAISEELKLDIKRFKEEAKGFVFEWGIGDNANKLIQTEKKPKGILVREKLLEKLQKQPEKENYKAAIENLQSELSKLKEEAISPERTFSREYTPEEMKAISKELGIEMPPIDQIKAKVVKAPEVKKIERELEILPDEIEIKNLSKNERKAIEEYFANEGITTEEFREIKTIAKEEYIAATKSVVVEDLPKAEQEMLREGFVVEDTISEKEYERIKRDQKIREEKETLAKTIDYGERKLYAGIPLGVSEFIEHDIKPASRGMLDFAKDVKNSLHAGLSPTTFNSVDVSQAPRNIVVERLPKSEKEIVQRTTGSRKTITRSEYKSILEKNKAELSGITYTTIARELAELQRAEDMATRKHAVRMAAFDRSPRDVQLDFMRAREAGDFKLDPKLIKKYNMSKQDVQRLENINKEYQDRMDKAHEMTSKNIIDNVGYIDDYMPHIWKNPQRARKFFKNRAIIMGKEAFAKVRLIDTIMDGLDAGLELVTTNPERLIQMRELSALQAQARGNVIRELSEKGALKSIGEADFSMGWREIITPMGKFAAPENVALFMDRWLSPGLWANKGWVGSIFRGGMKIKNASVGALLALSGWHLVETGVSSVVVQTMNGVRSIMEGNIAKGIKEIGTSPIAPIEALFGTGKKLDTAWYKETADMTPAERTAVNLMVRGGVRLKMSKQWRIDGTENLMQAVGRKDFFGTAIRLPGALIEQVAKPMFNYWIPRLKATAYLKTAELFIQRNPGISQNKLNRELFRISGEMDNRFGQMVYDNLFWNRMMKDIGVGYTLSMGWNLGTIREFGGAGIDTANALKNIATLKKPVLTDKMLYSAIYAIIFGMLGGTINYALTGEAPKSLKDLYYPRNGDTNPDGTPQRLQMPTMIKELFRSYNLVSKYGVSRGSWEMIGGKQAPHISTFVDLIQNKDFFSVEIRDPNSPAVQQAKDTVLFMLRQNFTPISVQQWLEADTTGGKRFLPFVGFIKAPRYITTSKTASKIEVLFEKRFGDRHISKEEHRIKKIKSELRRKYQKGEATNTDFIDAINQGALTARGVNLFLFNASLPSDIRLFRMLSVEDQNNLLVEMPRNDLDRYFQYAKKEVKALWGVR